jgi:hypothetical protein
LLKESRDSTTTCPSMLATLRSLHGPDSSIAWLDLAAWVFRIQARFEVTTYASVHSMLQRPRVLSCSLETSLRSNIRWLSTKDVLDGRRALINLRVSRLGATNEFEPCADTENEGRVIIILSAISRPILQHCLQRIQLLRAQISAFACSRSTARAFDVHAYKR